MPWFRRLKQRFVNWLLRDVVVERLKAGYVIVGDPAKLLSDGTVVFAPLTADPSTLEAGKLWYRSDLDAWYYSPDGTTTKQLGGEVGISNVNVYWSYSEDYIPNEDVVSLSVSFSTSSTSDILLLGMMSISGTYYHGYSVTVQVKLDGSTVASGILYPPTSSESAKGTITIPGVKKNVGAGSHTAQVYAAAGSAGGLYVYRRAIVALVIER